MNKRKWRKKIQFWIDKYGKRFAKFKTWYDDHAMQRKLIISGTLFLTMIGLLVGTRVAPSKSRFADTPLNTAESFGNDSNATIALTSRKYNAKQQFLVARFKVAPQSGQYIDPKNIKFKVRTLTKQDASYQVIPLVNNNFVVVIDNLPKGYKAIQLEAINKQGDSSQITYDASSSIDPESLSSSDSELSSSSSGNGQTGKKKNSYKFVINEDKKFVDNHLTRQTQKEYAVQSLQESIKLMNREIRKEKGALTTYQKQLAADQAAISQAKNNQQYQVDKDSNSDNIQQAQADIATQKQNIKNVNKVIKQSKLQIKLYQKQIDDIQSGKYKFPAKVATKKME